MNVFAGQDGDADVEDRLGDTGADEREGQTESNTETHTLPYVKQMCAQLLTHVRLFATPWTVARQAPLSMGFSRPEYWIR